MEGIIVSRASLFNEDRVFVLILILLIIGSTAGLIGIKGSAAKAVDESNASSKKRFTRDFNVDKNNLGPTGRNPFFVLEPGYTIVLQGKDEGEKATVEIKVLDQTREIDGVVTRVVRETERIDDEVVEISMNFFAIDKVSNSVFYFGEDVDLFKNGEVESHEGTWRSGVDGARFGLMMPGIQLLGARYFQEVAPDVALDKAETVGVSETVKTPAGTFKDSLKTLETTPLEPDVKENKIYAPGIGLVQDDNLKLARTTGVEMIRVPNIHGMLNPDPVLTRTGLRPKGIPIHGPIESDAAGIGEAYRQLPRAGALVARGTTVTYHFWWESQ